MMDYHQHQQQEGGSGIISKGSSSSSIICSRQSSSSSSSRWMPTTEQIRILKDLYYNGGVRSPSAEQIQRIAARLRQYGKIEGKNVFYWFQNHKARERQKKRLTLDVAPANFPNNMHMPAQAGISPNSPRMFGVGQMVNNNGPLLLERSYREYSVGGSVTEGNVEWVGAIMPPFGHHQHRPSYFYDSNYYYCNHPHPQKHRHPREEEEEEEEEAGLTVKETLPLFPVHSEAREEELENHQHYWDTGNGYFNGHHHCSGQHQKEEELRGDYLICDRSVDIDASLELTLNSYCVDQYARGS